jgi:hypothetical protein
MTSRRLLAIAAALLAGLAAAVFVVPDASAGADSASTTATSTTTASITTATVLTNPVLRVTKTAVVIRHCHEVKSKPVCVLTKVPGNPSKLTGREMAQLSGRLSDDGEPIAAGVVDYSIAIHHYPTHTGTLTTSTDGRFSTLFHGPNKSLNYTYSAVQGTGAAAGLFINASAALSLHVAKLKAGHKALFSGTLEGGYIPRDLYIQFSYLAGSHGYQPFAQLAIVHTKTGKFKELVAIPSDTAGFVYKLKAKVVASPFYPWAPTYSSVISRPVR